MRKMVIKVKGTGLRDSYYATEMKRTTIGENRLERLYVKEHNQEEIRLSWWPDGGMANRPLDMPEGEFIELLAKGISDGTLGQFFIFDLIEALKLARRAEALRVAGKIAKVARS